MDDPRQRIPETVILEKKQFLTEEQFEELCEVRGLKYRIDDYFIYCKNRGLQPSFKKEVFRKKVMGMLRSFLVDGDFRRDSRFVEPLKPENWK